MRKYSILKNSLIAIVLAVISMPAYHLLVITPAFSRFLNRTMEGNVKIFSRHLTSHLLQNGEKQLSTASLSSDFLEQVSEFQRDFKLLKVSLLDAQGRLIYTSTKGNEGNEPPASFTARKLLAGESLSKLIQPGKMEIDGTVYPGDVVETLMPIFNAQHKFMGVFEICYDLSLEDFNLTGLARRLNLMVGGSVLLMLLAIVALAGKEKKLARDREKTASELRLARDQWEQTFDSIGDLITIMDKDFHFVRVNRATSELFKTGKEQLLGRRCFEVFHNHDAPCNGCPALEDHFPKGAGSGEVYHAHLDKHLLVSTSPILDPDGQLTGYVHVARDITEHKNMERQLRHTQKMEAIGVLTGGVAHNFRNILASIKASAQVIEMTYPGDKQLKEIVGWVIESVDSGNQLVTGLGQFSRLKKGHEFQVLDLNKVAHDAYHILRGSLSRQVEMLLETHPGRLPINGNAGELLQVIINICNNANDAINGTGLIRIRLSRTGSEAILVISDNGPGIAPGIIDKIFEPFFTTKDVDKGTGLGLSTSYGIIAEHGGQTRASSEIGGGATFTITLPLLFAEKPGDDEIEAPNSTQAGERILVVDDEPSLVELNQRILVLKGYQVEGASGCSEALQKVRNWQPDLVLMDLNMPGLNGLACADAMYEIDPRIRVILISGSEIDRQQDLDGHRSHYVRAFLTKPVSLIDLETIIAGILSEGHDDH